MKLPHELPISTRLHLYIIYIQQFLDYGNYSLTVQKEITGNLIIHGDTKSTYAAAAALQTGKCRSTDTEGNIPTGLSDRDRRGIIIKHYFYYDLLLFILNTNIRPIYRPCQ